MDMICGFRSADIVIMEDEFRAASDNLYITTDDGTYGEKGFVTTKLKELLESGVQYDSILTCGPCDNDEVRGRNDEALRHQDHGKLEPHHDRRHRHVRRLPPDGRRRAEVCLRGRPGVRRAPGGLGQPA